MSPGQGQAAGSAGAAMAQDTHSVQPSHAGMAFGGGTALPLLSDPQTAPDTMCWHGLDASGALKDSREHSAEQTGLTQHLRTLAQLVTLPQEGKKDFIVSFTVSSRK